ncbi:MAG: MATE family efflux transporter [Chitinophagales bacterium]
MQKEIWRLAIPNILSNITVPLLSMVDAILMGHLNDPKYLGAVAVGGVIFNFIYWNVGFLRMGTTGLTAQAYGRKDDKNIILLLAQALLVAISLGIFVLCLQKPLEIFAFWLVEGSAEVEFLAKQYYQIRIWAAPATIALYAFNGWFLGMQNARYLMYVMLTINLINIVFSIIFVYLLGMTSEGVAYSTVLAQYTGLGLAVFLFLKKYTALLSHFEQKLLWQIANFKHFFAVNSNIFIRTFFLLITFAFFTLQSAKAGDTVLSANQILLEYLMLMSYFTDGFAFAAESLVGKYIGAKNSEKLKQSIYYSFRAGFVLAISATIVYALMGEKLLLLFTENQDIIAQASPYLPWLILLPIVSMSAYIWDGIYIGATAAVAMRNTMVASTVLFYLPVYFLLEPYLGNHALWLALTTFMIARSLLQTFLAKKYVFALVEN